MSSTFPTPSSAPRRRRRRGLRIAIVVLLVLLVLAVVAVVVGDGIFRRQAEQQIKLSVEENLPDSVQGFVVARIGGGSALLQYLQGSFDDVTIRSDGLRVASAPATAVVRVHHLPVHGGAIGSATARLTVDQAAFRKVPALQQANATAPVLGAGTVGTTLTQRFLGVPVKIAVRLKPSLSGQVVHLTPTSASLTAGPATVPATAIVQQLLPDGVSVCAASYLPRGITLTSVRAVRGAAVVGLTARGVDLATLGDGRTGSCG